MLMGFFLGLIVHSLFSAYLVKSWRKIILKKIRNNYDNMAFDTIEAFCFIVKKYFSQFDSIYAETNRLEIHCADVRRNASGFDMFLYEKLRKIINEMEKRPFNLNFIDIVRTALKIRDSLGDSFKYLVVVEDEIDASTGDMSNLCRYLVDDYPDKRKWGANLDELLSNFKSELSEYVAKGGFGTVRSQEFTVRVLSI